MDRRHGADHAEAATMSHDHSDSMDAAGGGHSTIFLNAANTPLYSLAWTPATDAGYAGTCIFLIFLAVAFRSLLALKAIMEQRWTDAELARRYVVVAGKQAFAERLSQDQSAKDMVLSSNGVEENVRVVSRSRAPGVARPWRFSVDPVRACVDVVIAGVGYLLMLAVMTMNVGYFLSVLGGVFVGSLAVGRYSSSSDH